MRAAIAAVDAAIAEGVPGVLGIHLEGPYSRRRDAACTTRRNSARPMRREIELASSLRNGGTVLTLAPERVPLDTIRELDATRRHRLRGPHAPRLTTQTRAALDAGVRGFTHLYNAMSPLTSREPGVVGAALEDARAGAASSSTAIHVHPASLRVALAAKPRGKMFLVTDAMPPVGADIGHVHARRRHDHLSRRPLRNAGRRARGLRARHGDARCATRSRSLGVPLAEAARMASTYPAEFLGIATARPHRAAETCRDS